MVWYIIGIILIVLSLAIYVFVDKKERYCGNRFEVSIFNRWQIPSFLIILITFIIFAIGLALIIL